VLAVIYLDTSVALAELFAEDRRPAPEFWRGEIVSSRLLEYELWTRVHGRKASSSHGEAVREILASVEFVELAPMVLARAVEPLPVGVRTLEVRTLEVRTLEVRTLEVRTLEVRTLEVRTLAAMHLATALFLAERRQGVKIATYDERMRGAARAVGLGVVEV
jgi:predicted nucleic acid-binding protein